MPETSILIPLQFPYLHDTPMVVMGNKCDLKKKKRGVTREEGEKKAEKYGAPFFEVSAKRGVNISEVCIY